MEHPAHYDLIDAARRYKMPAVAAELLNQHPPLMIASITAGGKTSISELLAKRSNYRHVITHTTRPIRPGETNGVNYWFVDDAEMLRLIEASELIETQPVHGETVYGTTIKAYKAVLDSGNDPFLIVDVQGVQEIVTGAPDLRAFFILPPSYEEWMKRLETRGAMSHTEKTRRLQSAKEEIQTALDDPHFILIVNNDLEQTASEIISGPTLINQPKNRQIAQFLLDNIKL